MSKPIAVELAPFTLAPGSSPEDLLAASERLEREFLAGADGYRGRILMRREDGRYADLVFWESEDKARAAMARAAQSEVCRGYFSCMLDESHDDPAAGVTLFSAVRNYRAMA